MKTSDIDLWKQALQQAGGRLTKPRKAILEVVLNSEHPLTAQEIFERARNQAPGLGLVTVYRTIEALEALNLIDRIHGHEQCQTVFRSAQGHRHLVTCTSCGRSAYFEGFLAENEFDRVGKQTGFAVKDHMLQLFGLCSDCQEDHDQKQ